MKANYFIRLLLSMGLSGYAYAGPEIYDPLAPYKKRNTLAVRPSSETVSKGGSTETAKFTYENGLLMKAEYVGPKKAYFGATTFEYENGQLVREKLIGPGGSLAEDIRYVYRKDRLEKTLIEDVRGNAHIEWHYSYDKEGNLIGGKRFNGKKITESFKLVATAGVSVQHIYNEKGELTAKVETAFENGLLKQRVKTGLTGARYAEYRYDAENRLSEIIFHETVRGEKILVKKHQFDYSMQKSTSYTLSK